MKQRYKTARCILYRGDEYLLAVHNRFWLRSEHRWGLPGGQIEWGESPREAAARELSEELRIRLPSLTEVGAFSYKRALHMVFAAPLDGDVAIHDETELLDIGWFRESDVARLKSQSALHAEYELDAIRQLRAQLGGARTAAAG